jgi:hypothetical protein
VYSGYELDGFAQSYVGFSIVNSISFSFILPFRLFGYSLASILFFPCPLEGQDGPGST